MSDEVLRLRDEVSRLSMEWCNQRRPGLRATTLSGGRIARLESPVGLRKGWPTGTLV